VCGAQASPDPLLQLQRDEEQRGQTDTESHFDRREGPEVHQRPNRGVEAAVRNMLYRRDMPILVGYLRSCRFDKPAGIMGSVAGWQGSVTAPAHQEPRQ